MINHFKKILANKNKSLAQNTKASEQNYFTLARNWADDFYTATETARNRWRFLSVFILLPMVALLLFSIAYLIPIQHLEPLIIHQYENGLVTVEAAAQDYVPHNQNEVEHDLTRYVRFREGYSADSYDYQYRLINNMSAADVAATYNRVQSIDNKKSPINVLGKKAYKTVKILNVLFLDNKNKNTGPHHSNQHRNLAQVDFVVTEHDQRAGVAASLPLTALISWEYRGLSRNPGDRWLNWNGFTVTHYRIQQRNT